MSNVTDEEKQQYQRWVANYFSGKIDEFSYRLEEIVAACDISLACAMAGQNHPEGTEKSVTYGFSAFSNLVQTLKDSASSFINSEVRWGSIKALRHGQFFYLSRNAATHDGNPIISCWVDGYFYVPSDIRRLDKNGGLVVIPAPTADVRTACLEFSADLTKLLAERLSGIARTPFLLGPSYDFVEVASVMTSALVPQFSKGLFAQNAEQFQAVAKACKFDPVEDAVRKLSAIQQRCKGLLQS